jgi:shikimate dehydrogenase
LGIIGYPLERTASPLIHNTAFRLLGIPWTYAAFPVKPNDLKAALRGFEATGVIGFNVTYPHKVAILPYLQHVSERAEVIGAVNTVWRWAGGWWGDNTDVAGFVSPLRKHRASLRGKFAVVFGAGGAARAVAYALIRKLHVGALLVVVRNPKRAAAFGTWANGLDSNIPVDVEPLQSPTRWANAFRAAKIVVNATSVGMLDESCIVSKAVAFSKGQIAYDLVYGRRTTFLRRAAASKAVPIDGSPMLWAQAAKSFYSWTGKRLPAKATRY